MLRLLFYVFIEVLIAVSLAGVILALAIPALNRSGSVGQRDPATTIIIGGVLVAAVAVALFRPGSAIHRYIKR
jgi:hypothetical protein